jgi:hypothetical protein
MSRRDRELPEDLARLGVYLETAAAAAVRRRNRRQAIVNFVGTLAVAVPCALAVAAADLSPSDTFAPARAGMLSFVEVEQPTNGFMVRHIPDEWLPPRRPPLCLDAKDCRAPRRPSLEPAPAGRL